MLGLIAEAFSIGYMVLIFLVGLLIYLQVTVKDPEARKRAVFKTVIGIAAAMMAFIAIANYKVNFYGNSRLLPVSLVMITALTFMMAIYFTNISALLKIGGFMFFVAAALSGVLTVRSITGISPDRWMRPATKWALPFLWPYTPIIME